MSKLDDIEERLTAADNMVHALCQPRHTEGTREWYMSIPARPDYDPDLVIGASLWDTHKLLRLARAIDESEWISEGDRQNWVVSRDDGDAILAALHRVLGQEQEEHNNGSD